MRLAGSLIRSAVSLATSLFALARFRRRDSAAIGLTLPLAMAALLQLGAPRHADPRVGCAKDRGHSVARRRLSQGRGPSGPSRLRRMVMRLRSDIRYFFFFGWSELA